MCHGHTVSAKENSHAYWVYVSRCWQQVPQGQSLWGHGCFWKVPQRPCHSGPTTEHNWAQQPSSGCFCETVYKEKGKKFWTSSEECGKKCEKQPCDHHGQRRRGGEIAPQPVESPCKFSWQELWPVENPHWSRGKKCEEEERNCYNPLPPHPPCVAWGGRAR